MELVVCVGLDRESWGQITGLIHRGTWDKVIVVRNSQADDFPTPEQAEEVLINSSLPLLELKSYLKQQLKPKLSEFEACLSVASGNGKEHIALISALLTIPVGIRFVALTKSGVEFIN